jgi:hypothetical protein
MTHETDEPKSLRFVAPVAAEDLQGGQIVVVDGHVVETHVDPADPDRLRVVIARALAGVDDDRREVVLSVPADMKLATAEPFNSELPPIPSSS